MWSVDALVEVEIIASGYARVDRDMVYQSLNWLSSLSLSLIHFYPICWKMRGLYAWKLPRLLFKQRPSIHLTQIERLSRLAIIKTVVIYVATLSHYRMPWSVGWSTWGSSWINNTQPKYRKVLSQFLTVKVLHRMKGRSSFLSAPGIPIAWA